MFSQIVTMQPVQARLLRWMAAALAGLALAMVLALAAPARADGLALDDAMDTVLTVRSNDASDRFLGSAFLWGEEAVVAVTNAHVVGNAS